MSEFDQPEPTPERPPAGAPIPPQSPVAPQSPAAPQSPFSGTPQAQPPQAQPPQGQPAYGQPPTSAPVPPPRQPNPTYAPPQQPQQAPPAYAPYQAAPGQGVPAQGFPPQGGGGGPFQPPALIPPKKSKWKKVLLIIGIVVVLPLAGIGACSFWLFGQLKGPVDETNAFMALVQVGQYDTALASSDQSCGAFVEVFIDEAKSNNVLAYNFFISELNTVNGVTTGSTDGSVTFVNEGAVNVRVELTKSGDDWQVCRVLPGVGAGAP